MEPNNIQENSNQGEHQKTAIKNTFAAFIDNIKNVFTSYTLNKHLSKYLKARLKLKKVKIISEQ